MLQCQQNRTGFFRHSHSRCPSTRTPLPLKRKTPKPIPASYADLRTRLGGSENQSSISSQNAFLVRTASAGSPTTFSLQKGKQPSRILRSSGVSRRTASTTCVSSFVSFIAEWYIARANMTLATFAQAISIRARKEERLVDDTEDRSLRTDSQCQRDNSDRRKPALRVRRRRTSCCLKKNLKKNSLFSGCTASIATFSAIDAPIPRPLPYSEKKNVLFSLYPRLTARYENPFL